MAGEIIEGTATESRGMVGGEIIVAAPPTGEAHGPGAVAILLTIAAVVAAAIGFRAATISSSASDSWQSALRTEVKRSAAVMEDVRYLYQSELPVAIRVVQARITESEMLAAAQAESGATKQALLMEASVEAQIASALAKSTELATNPDYALASGGLDLGRRLADLRNQQPALLALDPDALQATGDELAAKAATITVALIPTSVAAFLGVLAQPFRRRRILLLRLATVALAGGAIMAAAVEVMS
jgi:hypothetical protein